MAGFGRSMMQAAGAMAAIGREEQQEEENIQFKNEIARAGAQEISGWEGFKLRLSEFQDNPEKALEAFDNEYPNIEKSVLSETSLDLSHSAMTNDLIVKKAEWRAWVADWAQDENKRNVGVNYEAGRKNAMTSKVWINTDDLADSLAYNYGNAQDAYEGGYLTDEQLQFNTRQLFQYQIKDYLLQLGDEKYINNPNSFVEETGLNIPDAERELYGSEDIAKLKQDFEIRKNINEYEAKVLREKREAEVESEARDFAVANDFKSGIDKINSARHELGADWHTNALNKYKNAFSIINTTGENPFTKTQSWDRFGEIRQKILDREVRSEKEIRDYTGKKDGYAIAQEKYLLDLYNGNESSAKAFEDSAAAQNLKALINYNIAEEKDEPDIYQFATQRGLGLLQDTITNNPDWTDREKKEAALRIGRQLEREYEDGTLETALENVIKGPLYSKLKPSGFIKPGGKKSILRTATNPKTGERIGWNGTEWIPIQ